MNSQPTDNDLSGQAVNTQQQSLPTTFSGLKKSLELYPKLPGLAYHEQDWVSMVEHAINQLRPRLTEQEVCSFYKFSVLLFGERVAATAFRRNLTLIEASVVNSPTAQGQRHEG